MFVKYFISYCYQYSLYFLMYTWTGQSYSIIYSHRLQITKHTTSLQKDIITSWFMTSFRNNHCFFLVRLLTREENIELNIFHVKEQEFTTLELPNPIRVFKDQILGVSVRNFLPFAADIDEVHFLSTYD